MREADIHPCFFCTLADCDDGSPDCGLRKARNRYKRAMDAKQPVSDLLRAQNNIAYQELYAAERNERRRVAGS